MIKIKEVMNLNTGEIYYKNKLIFRGDIASEKYYDAIYDLAVDNPDAYECIYNYVEDNAPELFNNFDGYDDYVREFREIVKAFSNLLANNFVNNSYDDKHRINTFDDSSDDLSWVIVDADEFELY